MTRIQEILFQNLKPITAKWSNSSDRAEGKDMLYSFQGSAECLKEKFKIE